ncbi:uncharacterized protein LOC124122176 isoform X2 [Haliotis rufescens]|uniref:uncharacterized protein LOC124122176 isoform X2 n=1 Tax=Haliotis rufescens TaxID=6454 RepID=UPI00201F783D|nr:uncharacterized protein LOC124122176 isoform X2 [Haliotis rufescens]
MCSSMAIGRVFPALCVALLWSGLGAATDQFDETTSITTATPDQFDETTSNTTATPDQFDETTSNTTATPDQFNETTSNITATPDYGHSLGSMTIAIITLSLLLAASVAVNVIIVVIKIKRKFRRPKKKAVFDLVRYRNNPNLDVNVELTSHNTAESLENQPNTAQPELFDDEYEDLSLGSQKNDYETPVSNIKEHKDLARTNANMLNPPMRAPGSRPDTRVSIPSRLAVESRQQDDIVVQRVPNPVQRAPTEPSLPVRPERSTGSPHPEPTESSGAVDIAFREQLVARDSLAIHARRMGLDTSHKRKSGAYTLPEDGANYSVSDIEETFESEEDDDDGLYENEVDVMSAEHKKQVDSEDDSDPYENEDFIDTQFRRLKYKYKLSSDDGGTVDDDGDTPLHGSAKGGDRSEDEHDKPDDTIGVACMAVQYNSNDHLNDIEEEEEEESGEEEAEDGVFAQESGGRNEGVSRNSDQDSDFVHVRYRRVHGLVVSVDADIDDDDGDDRDLYENEMQWRRISGGCDAEGVSVQRNLDGKAETFVSDVSRDGGGMDQGEEKGAFVEGSTQSFTGMDGEINEVEEEEQEVGAGTLDDVDGIYDDVEPYDPNITPKQTSMWETFPSNEGMPSRLGGIPLESQAQQTEIGSGRINGQPWGDLHKGQSLENESQRNGFADNELNPHKQVHGSMLDNVPASHQHNVRWTVGDSESSGQTNEEEELNDWSQALDSDFQLDPRGPVAVFNSDSDEYDV